MFYKMFLKMLKINDESKIKLLGKFDNSQEIYNNINIILPQNIYRPSDNEVKGVLEYIKRNNINFVSVEDKDYPQNLRYVNNKPYGLFYKGKIDFLQQENKVAIIGARNCTSYGNEAGKFIAKEICKNNVITISGGAIGIDTITHEMAIKENSKTCVVLGSGVDVVYPKRNKELFNEVEKTGCLLSEFLPKTPAFPYNFPMRNRIISGLCDKLIVIEGGEKSGTLITATYAVEQGKDVMAIPGTIFSEKSKGTNRLIQEGAQIYTCKEDLYKFCGIEYNLVRNFNKYNKKIKTIINILESEPIHINDIIRLSNIDIKDIYAVLFELQLKNEIICLPGNYYAKII